MHGRQRYGEFLTRLPPQSAMAVEATDATAEYWMRWSVPVTVRNLANALEASGAFRSPKNGGLAILLRNGTLRKLWIPPRKLRDQRELLRLRIFLVHVHTCVKKSDQQHISPTQRADSRSDESASQLVCNLARGCRNFRSTAARTIEQELAILDFLET